MVRSYLFMVERDPEIYRFVMTRPLETTEFDPNDRSVSSPAGSASS